MQFTLANASLIDRFSHWLYSLLLFILLALSQWLGRIGLRLGVRGHVLGVFLTIRETMVTGAEWAMFRKSRIMERRIIRQVRAEMGAAAEDIICRLPRSQGALDFDAAMAMLEILRATLNRVSWSVQPNVGSVSQFRALHHNGALSHRIMIHAPAEGEPHRLH